MRVPESFSRNEKLIYGCVGVFLLGYTVWLALFSPVPLFYSYNEYNRANAACVGNAYVGCASEKLTKWRKSAPPDAPRGSF